MVAEIGKSRGSVAMEKRRKGNVNCCIKSCKNIRRSASEKINFYCFPKANYKTAQRQLWINWVKKENSHDWEPATHSRICSAHFVGNQSSVFPSSPSYVPSISGRKEPELTSREKCAIQRFDRSMRRKMSGRQCYKDDAATVDAEKNTPEELQESSHHLDELIEPPTLLLRLDKEIQVVMIGLTADHRNLFNGTTFVCAQYVHNDICHVQTQVFIPENHGSIAIVKKRHSSDKCCGPSIVQVDKAIGPDNRDCFVGDLTVCTTGFHGISSITKDQGMLDLCGVTLSTFKLLLSSLPGNQPKKISKENRLLIFLTKLKTGMSFSAIGVLFRIHRTTASRIFFTVLQVLRVTCSNFITWPCRDVIQSTMPEDFKHLYGNTTVIIDCTEFRSEQPNTVESRVYMYSHYKKGFTVKVLVGCTPCGFVSFLSSCYGGRTSDCQITIDSGILDLLQPHDVVLADKGFPGIQTVLDENQKGALIVLPPFLHNGQFSAEDVERTYEIAKVRIHIERIMQRLRIYKILDKFSIDMLSHADNIVFVCAALVNLQPPIIKDGDVDETDLYTWK